MMNDNALSVGRQINHFSKVDDKKISTEFSEDMRYRYKLSLPFFSETKRTKRIAIILKNPSSAEANKADKTVHNTAKVIYDSFPDVGTVEILNLFAIRGTYPKEVKKAYDDLVDIIGPCNDAAISEVISQCDYVVLAWGGSRPLDKVCQATFKNDHLRQIKMTNLVIAFH